MSTGNRPPGALSRALQAVAAGPRPLRAWVDVDDLPWGDPDFSQRMLREHLDESHGAASRRPAEIARQVDLLAAWLRDALAPGGAVLDVKSAGRARPRGGRAPAGCGAPESTSSCTSATWTRPPTRS